MFSCFKSPEKLSELDQWSHINLVPTAWYSSARSPGTRFCFPLQTLPPQLIVIATPRKTAVTSFSTQHKHIQEPWTYEGGMLVRQKSAEKTGVYETLDTRTDEETSSSDDFLF